MAVLEKKDQLKVHLIARHLARINPDVRIKEMPHSVVVSDAASALLDRDVIFICVDNDHWGRAIVNQIAYQYLIPTVNLGIRVVSERGHISAAAGNVDVLRPDMPCLWCRQVIRAERIAAESMPFNVHVAREKEGYVEGSDTYAPAVVSLNSIVAGLAVTQFLQLITDFMGPSGDVSRLNYDPLDGTVRRGSAT